MLELIKDYLSDKNKLWKIIMIFSIVLFFLILSLFIWRLFSNQAAEDGDKSTKKTQNEPDTSLNSQRCEGCVRRQLDGVYVKPEEANRPPIAVMIDNHPSARPQSGIEKANLVYEAEVEGSYTRLMAVFAAAEIVDQIGPVRSARSYFVDWAQELGAVYAHCGGSPEALVELAQKNMADLNEMYNGQYFWRAENRLAPHNIMTSSANLDKFIENKKIANSDYSSWLFKDDAPANDSIISKNIEINFNLADFKTSWVYDKTDNDYIRYFDDKPYLTADKNLIIAKNVIIQIVPAKVIDDKLRLEMENIGSGKAVICQDGSCQPGAWSKENHLTRTTFTYDSGEEVKFNAGTTWVEVVRPEISLNF